MFQNDTMAFNRLIYVLLLISMLKIDAQFTNVGLFWSNRGEVHGGKMEAGVKVAIEKINNNNTILGNTTFRLFHSLCDCNKKNILAGTIQFVSPDLMDFMIGDQCQTTTELGGLVASLYNIPFFDFSRIPRYLTDKNYGTLLRAGGDANKVRSISLTVAEHQSFYWTCLFVPQQIRQNVQRVRQAFSTLKEKRIVIMKQYYFDLITNDYSALKEIKTSCRGMYGKTLVFGYSHYIKLTDSPKYI